MAFDLRAFAEQSQDGISSLPQDNTEDSLVLRNRSKRQDVEILPNTSHDQIQNESRGKDYIGSPAWKPRLSITIFVLIALLVSAFLFTTRRNKFDKLCPRSTPLDARGPAEFLDNILAPYSINITAHEAIIREPRDWDKLQSLISIQAEVSSSSKITSQKLISSFGRAYKMISNKPPGPDLLEEIQCLHQQVRYSIFNVSRLSHLYQSLEFAYYTLDPTATDTFKATQPGDLGQLVISAEPHRLKTLGLDARGVWRDPWMGRKKKLEEARLAIIALEREYKRLQQITQTLQSLDISLLQLPVTLLIESEKQGGRLSFIRSWIARLRSFRGNSAQDSDTIRTRLTKWFREHVACLLTQDQGNLTEEEFNSWWEQLNCGFIA